MSKKGSKYRIVSGITNAGNIDPISVPGVPDPGPTVADRVSALEGEAQTLKNGVAALSMQITGNDKRYSDNADALKKAINNEFAKLQSEDKGDPGILELPQDITINCGENGFLRRMLAIRDGTGRVRYYCGRTQNLKLN